jgi:hypothetical protein
MHLLETQFMRFPDLASWFIEIVSPAIREI